MGLFDQAQNLGMQQLIGGVGAPPPQGAGAPTGGNPLGQLAAMLQRIKSLQPQTASGQPLPQASPQPPASQVGVGAPQAGPVGPNILTSGQASGPAGQPRWMEKGSAVGDFVSDIQGVIQRGKQKKFEEASVDGAVYYIGKQADDKIKAGAKLTPQEQSAYDIYKSEKFQKKLPKVAEQALEPMSGVYVGILRAQAAMEAARKEQEDRQAQLAKHQADEAYRRMMGQAALGRNVLGEERLTEKTTDDAAKRAADEQKEKDRVVLQDAKQNFRRPQVDDQGNLMRSPDGTLLTREMTKEDIKGNAELEQKYAAQQSLIDKRLADSRRDAQKLVIDRFKAESGRISANASMLRAQKYEPSAGRAGGGGRLSATMQKNVMLSGMAKDYLDQMQVIAAKHPEFFGPSGLFKTKLEQYAGEGNQDAMQYIKLAQAASLPLAGIHNMRNQKVVGEIENTLMKQWQDPKSALDGIRIYQDTAQGVIEGRYIVSPDGRLTEARPMPAASPATPPASQGPRRVITVTADDMK